MNKDRGRLMCAVAIIGLIAMVSVMITLAEMLS